jgi:carnosine N-methyltransferase
VTAPATPPLRGYHIITTLFFIDTSLNVIETIEHIYRLLRPGGTWINLGPLLWSGGAQAKVELSLEEVMSVAEAIGFMFDREIKPDKRSGRTVECEYTADSRAMMQWIYKAEFWVARKPK